MKPDSLHLTYIGGPTALIEFGGVRLLTDHTFDPAGGEYTTGLVTLRKLAGPALERDALGPFDYILLSHDHHSDNLDHAGRATLASAKKVLTTDEGAQRLGENSVGLKDWQAMDIPAPGGRVLRVVATPARHGPEGLSRGAVIGFALFFPDAPDKAVYVSGDTVWYQGVVDVAQRFKIRVAMLHLGAARVPEVGTFHLTMTAEEAVLAARSFANAAIVPIHFEDWAHFSEGRTEVTQAFTGAGLVERLRWLPRGVATRIDL